MIRRLPPGATLIVLVAVAIMIRLGFWQIARLHEKEALLTRYSASVHQQAPVPWPASPEAARLSLYRHSQILCTRVTGITAVSGRNAAGSPGWAHVAICARSGGTTRVVLGWSNGPEPVNWGGGIATGVIAPGDATGPRLVADPPLAGLAANATPDPRDIPNNHLSYAVQWFLFAATALVIYAIAVRKHLRAG
jgi:surfeit locus 1 family protein